MKKKIIALTLAVLVVAAAAGYFALTYQDPRGVTPKEIDEKNMSFWQQMSDKRSQFTWNSCGILKKACEESVDGATYSITFLRGYNGTFSSWTERISTYFPRQHDIQNYSSLRNFFRKTMGGNYGNPAPPSSYIVTCSCTSMVYRRVDVGDLADITITREGRDDDGQATRIQKNYGPMVYNPDGLIMWLYRDLPKE